MFKITINFIYNPLFQQRVTKSRLMHLNHSEWTDLKSIPIMEQRGISRRIKEYCPKNDQGHWPATMSVTIWIHMYKSLMGRNQTLLPSNQTWGSVVEQVFRLSGMSQSGSQMALSKLSYLKWPLEENSCGERWWWSEQMFIGQLLRDIRGQWRAQIYILAIITTCCHTGVQQHPAKDKGSRKKRLVAITRGFLNVWLARKSPLAYSPLYNSVTLTWHCQVYENNYIVGFKTHICKA